MHIGRNVDQVTFDWRKVHAPSVHVAPSVYVLELFFQDDRAAVDSDIEFDFDWSLHTRTCSAVDDCLVVESNLAWFAVDHN